jgi:hypothetical protein
MGVRNSTGVLSEVLSTVIDRPCCDRAGVCSWVVGLEKTLFGGAAYEGPILSVVATTARALSIEARGGGGGIIVVCRDLGFEVSDII